MTERLKPGDYVQHFKRETLKDAYNGEYTYFIRAFATHSETREKYVVYQACYGKHEFFIRPYEMFMSKVDKKKHPNIKQEYRFELVLRTWGDMLGGSNDVDK